MTRPVSIAWAPEDTAEALHAQYRAEPTAEAHTRLHALWRLRLGEGPTAVAAVVGVSRNAVQQWLRWYRAGGLAEVRSHRRGGHGSPGFLMPDQQDRLVAEAAKGKFGTAQAVRDWIEEQSGMVYAVGSLYTLLPRLGLRLKAPRPQHPQAAPPGPGSLEKGGGGSRHG